MNKEKRIPTIIGLVLLLISILVGVIFTGNKTFFRSKASTSCNPLNYQVTNITNKSLDISFTTSTECTTAILIDNRTIPNLRGSSKIHYFQIDNLKDDTEYSFSFLNNGTTFSESNYKTKTAKNPTGIIPTSNLAWGRVLNSNLKPSEEAIVYFIVPGASPLSSFVTSNGNWNISLASSFNDTKTNWFVSKENVDEDIIVISPNQVTQVTANSSHNNPVPDIIIGQNSLTPEKITPSPTPAASLIIPTVTPSSVKTTIQSPKENEVIVTVKPDFFGTAPINSQVLVKIESVTGNTITNTSGTWHWSPSENLSVGEHTLFITNENGSETVSRKFTIMPQSDTLSFSATPSAVMITPTSIPTPTVKPTIRAAKPSTSSGVPVTGAILPTIFSLVVSSIFIFGSVFLIKK